MRDSDEEPPYRFMTLHEFQFSDAKDSRPFCIGHHARSLISNSQGAIVINDAFPTLVDAARNCKSLPDRGTVLITGNLHGLDEAGAIAVMERLWFALNSGDRRLITDKEDRNIKFMAATAYAAKHRVGDGLNPLINICEDYQTRLAVKVDIAREYIRTGRCDTAGSMRR